MPEQAKPTPIDLERSAAEPDSGKLVLASGREIHVDSTDPNQINISSPEGTFELSVKFTPNGAVFNLSAAQLNLRSSGAMTLECRDLAIHAEKSAILTAGSLTEQITTTHQTVVGGRSELEAHAVCIRSRLGDVAIEANDLVKVTGEKILLNR